MKLSMQPESVLFIANGDTVKSFFSFKDKLSELLWNSRFSVNNDLKVSNDDEGRVFLASVTSMSLLTGQFVNGEEHGDSVTLQIHHHLMESRLDDQRVERRG